jgi:hypothetical protein
MRDCDKAYIFDPEGNFMACMVQDRHELGYISYGIKFVVCGLVL